jgi:hypothetical protein
MYHSFEALPYWAGKNSTTKGTKYTKGEQGLIYRLFPFVTIVYFVFRKVFPLKTVEPPLILGRMIPEFARPR